MLAMLRNLSTGYLRANEKVETGEVITPEVVPMRRAGDGKVIDQAAD